MGTKRAFVDDLSLSLVRGIAPRRRGRHRRADHSRLPARGVQPLRRSARRWCCIAPMAVVRWSYQDLWERSVEVAKALIDSGVGKDSRVGILMTNRPEYLSTVFGTALAGGVAVALSTFSTPGELEYLIAVVRHFNSLV